MNGLIVYLLVLHFIGDFVLQTDDMALNKSTSNLWLLAHVGMYYLTIMGGLTAMAMSVLPLLSGENFMALMKTAMIYSAVNAAAHGIIDYVSSRVSSYFFTQGLRHEFFVTIGFDQLLHAAILIGTLGLLK